MSFNEDGETEAKPESAVYDQGRSFSPYDPPAPPEESIQPSPPSPTQQAEGPGSGDTSGNDGQPATSEAPEVQEAEQEPLPEFDPRYQQEFEGLLWLGRLQETFHLLGHVFTVKTLTTEEMTEIALIQKPYLGTKAEFPVYQTAWVAAAVVTADGKALPQGLGPDSTKDLADIKYPYVNQNWMPAVREEIYNRCFALEVLARKVLEELGKASG